MNRVDGYDSYRTNAYAATQSANNAGKTAAAQEKDPVKSERPEKINLSERAKDLLKDLQKKYGNMDFIVANYETDEEAERYLSRGTRDYSVLLTPEELEKMAADEDYKSRNLKTLDDAVSKLDEMKKQLGDKENEVSRIGIAIGDDGEVSYFAELEKVSEKQRERIEKSREENREETKAEKKDGEPVKRTMVRADSVEELLKRIKEVDWNQVKAEEEPVAGRKFDFMA